MHPFVYFLLGVAVGIVIMYGINAFLDWAFPKRPARNKLDAAQHAEVIDKALGEGWVENLANNLK